jgi:hypothetical protein
MAVPKATALHSGAHETSYPYTDLAPTKNISLTGSATNGPILEWEWSIVPTDPNNAGGLPAASGLLTSTSGDFSNGKATVQNPSLDLDAAGGYNFQLRARNADGWSDPSYPSAAAPTADGTDCQAIVYILTPRGLKQPPANMYRYEDNLNATLGGVEDRLGINAPGTAVMMFRGEPASTQNISSGTYADIPGSALPEQEFEIPTTGWYDLAIVLSSLSSTTSNQQAKANYQAIFDESDFNGFTEQTLGANASYPEEWQVFTANGGTTAWEYKTVLNEIYMEAGTHKVKFQAKTDLNTPRVGVEGTFMIKGVLRSGSGAGGFLYNESPALSSNYAVGTSFADIDNGGGDKLEVTVSTFEGEQVVLFAHVRISQTSQGDTSLRFTIDGSPVENFNWSQSNSTAWNEIISITQISGSLSAGSHTFILQATRNNASSIWAGAKIGVLRFRGGLIPIESDGTVVTDTPAAVNYKGFGVTQQLDGTVDVEANAAVAVPGSIILTDPVSYPSSASPTTSYAILDDGGGNTSEFTVEIPVTGTYRIQLVQTHWSAASNEVDFRLNIDSGTEYVGASIGGASPPGTPADSTWRIRGDGSSTRIWPMLVAEVDLTAGQHTIDVEWAYAAGTTGTTLNQYDRTRLVLGLITGSGAGGVILDAQVKNGGDQVISTGSWQKITGLEHTFIASADENVALCTAIHFWNTSGSTCGLAYSLDGGTTRVLFAVKYTQWSGDFTAEIPIAGLSGSQSLEIWAYTETANMTIRGGTAAQWGEDYESKSWIKQYRGGLIPIRADGTTLTDKPAALNFIGHGAYLSGDAVNIEMNEALTAVGSTVEMLNVGAITTTTTSASFEDMSGYSGTFEAPVAGKYALTFTVDGYATSNTASARYQLVFDAAGTPQTIGNDDESWELGTGGNPATRAYKTMVAEVDLTAGSHTIKVQWKRETGSGTWNADVISSVLVRGTLVSGSGAGGLLVEEKTGAYTGSNPMYTAASWTDVQDQSGGSPMEVSIDTAEGDDVIINFIGYAWNPSGTNWIDLRVLKDGTDVVYNVRHRFGTSSEDSDLPFTVVDKDVTAGTHTYKLQVWVNGGITVGFNTTSSSYPFVLTAAIARGGLVPIRQDGATVIDKPAAINVVGPNATVTNTGGTANLQFNGATGRITDTRYFSYFYDAPSVVTSQNFSVGIRFWFTKTGLMRGIQFRTAETAARSFRGKLWNNTTEAASGTLSTSAAGLYELWFDDPYEITEAMLGQDTFYLSLYETTTPGDYTNQAGDPPGAPLEKIGRGWVSYDGIPHNYLSGGDSAPPTSTAGVGRYPIDPIFEFDGDPAGFVQPENIPVLQYDTAANVDLVAAPGADAVLRLKLNDGAIYEADSPLSIDLTVSGPGGLDTGSEASSTWYFAYAIKDTAVGRFDVVASVTDPATGPTGYDVWRYLGFFRNDSSSNIKPFDYRSIGIYRARNSATADSDIVIYSETAGTPSTGAWVNLTLTNAIPTAVAGAVTLESFLDSDASGIHQLNIEPGNPPAFTPEGDNSLRGAAVLVAQDGMQMCQAKTVPLFDGTLSRYWVTRSGAVDLGVDVREIYDKYLTTAHTEARVPAPYTPDTKSPKGTWATATTVSFGARPGQPSTTRLTLQDGTQRTMTTGTWNVANGVADWGYDEAASQGNSKVLYFYAVPKSGDDTQVVVRVSDNGPSTGPTGYTNFKLVWATYIDGSGNLIEVHQRRNTFWWNAVRAIYSDSNVTPFALTAFDLALPATGNTGPYCPLSAGEVNIDIHMWHTTTATDRWDFQLSYDGTNVTGLAVVEDPAQNTTGHMDEELTMPVNPANNSRIYLALVRNYGSSPNVNYLGVRVRGWIDEWIDP